MTAPAAALALKVGCRGSCRPYSRIQGKLSSPIRSHVRQVSPGERLYSQGRAMSSPHHPGWALISALHLLLESVSCLNSVDGATSVEPCWAAPQTCSPRADAVTPLSDDCALQLRQRQSKAPVVGATSKRHEETDAGTSSSSWISKPGLFFQNCGGRRHLAKGCTDGITSRTCSRGSRDEPAFCYQLSIVLMSYQSLISDQN